MTEVALVTGLSGAGKASILRALEDMGYEAVDNPPLTLVDTLVARRDRPLAIGLDARTRGFDASAVLATLERLRRVPGLDTQMIFATAEPPVLLRRFTETRRRHPMAPDGRVLDGIEAEIVLTWPLRDGADAVIDTTELPLPALRQMIERRFGLEAGPAAGMTVVLMSFAFPAGLPREADMVFDARFLRNPHYDPILRPLTGLDAGVAAFVEADPDFNQFFIGMRSLLCLVLPRFVQEGKKYATIAVGCTGGRHRSVRIVELLASTLQPSAPEGRPWRWLTLHRELTAGLGLAIGAPAPVPQPAGHSSRPVPQPAGHSSRPVPKPAGHSSRKV